MLLNNKHYYNLPPEERKNLWKHYKKVYPNMGYTDMVKHFNSEVENYQFGGRTDYFNSDVKKYKFGGETSGSTNIIKNYMGSDENYATMNVDRGNIGGEAWLDTQSKKIYPYLNLNKDIGKNKNTNINFSLPIPVKGNNTFSIGITKTFADGGKTNTLEGDLISKVIMNRNKDKDFVKRAYAVGQYPESNMFTRFDPDQFGQKNSHLMSWGEDDKGQAYMFPEIMNPNNEAIKIPNQYADYITSEGYKKVTNIPIKKSKGGKVTFSTDGEKHIVYKKESPTGMGKGKKGHIMVNHPTKDKGKWDTIDLTEKANAKTVAQGVAATKKWHKENPMEKYAIGGKTDKYVAEPSTTATRFRKDKPIFRSESPRESEPMFNANNWILQHMEPFSSIKDAYGIYDAVKRGDRADLNKSILSQIIPFVNYSDIELPKQVKEAVNRSEQENKDIILKRNKKAKGGLVEKYQEGGETDNIDQNNNQVYTYQTNPEYFDNKAVIHENPQYNELIKKSVYAGTHGYNPNTGELIKLKNKVEVPEETQIMSTKEYGKASQKERFATNPELRKQYIQKSTEEAYQNPLMYAPGMIYGSTIAPALGAITNIPSLIESSDNIIKGKGKTLDYANLLFSLPASKYLLNSAKPFIKRTAKIAADQIDDAIYNIKYKNQIKNLEPTKFKLLQQINNPEGWKRLRDQGIDPKSFLNQLNKTKVSSIRNAGSWDDSRQINIDFDQLKYLKKLGYNLDVESVMAHEIGHRMQRGFNSPAVKKYNEVMEALNRRKAPETLVYSTPLDKESAQLLAPVTKDMLHEDADYFFQGTEHHERLPFLRETKMEMKNKGYISDIYSKINSETIKRFLKENPGNRFARFLNVDSPITHRRLSSLLNKTPIVAGAAVATDKLNEK